MPLDLDLSFPRLKTLLLFSTVSTESVSDLTAEMLLGALLLAGTKFLIQSRSFQPYSAVFARDKLMQTRKAAKRHQVRIFLSPILGDIHYNAMKIFYQLLQLKRAQLRMGHNTVLRSHY